MCTYPKLRREPVPLCCPNSSYRVVRYLLVVEVLAFFTSQARNLLHLVASKRERENLDGNDTPLMDVWT
jgi:hypothetical protein